MDTHVRALERAAAAGDPLARQQLDLELERSGALDGLDQELDALLAEVQPQGAPWPTTSMLDVRALAAAVEAVATSPGPAWRLLVADHHQRHPTASPEGSYAAIALHGDVVIVGLERGDTRRAFALRSELGPASEPLAALGVLGGRARSSVVRRGRAVAAAWGRRRLRRAEREQLEHIRRRPAMYVGDAHERGVRALADEVLDRVAGLHTLGRCRRVRVRRLPDGACSVEDDAADATGGASLEATLTGLGASSGSYPATGGLHGVGLGVVNALSAWLEAELHQDGLVVRQRFERGQAVAPPAAVGPTDRAGLTVSFLPDPTVFQAGAAVGADWLARRLRELSYLHPGLRATLEVDGQAPSAETFCAERGVEDGLAALVGDARTLLWAPLVASAREQVTPGALPVVVDVALTWTRQEGEQVVDYANGVLLREGGTHRAALRAAVTRALSPLGDGTRGVDWCQGLAAFVSLKVPEPLYQGCTRSRLANPEVGPLLRRLVGRALKDLVAARPAEAERVVKQALARSRRKKLPRARAQGPLP